VNPSRFSIHCFAIIGLLTAIQETCAATITDVSYFTSRPHTLVTFEQRGDGSPTPMAIATPIPADEYRTLGFNIRPGLSPGVAWVNDLSTNADAAQAIGGSLPLGIAAMDNQGDFFIDFSPNPVRAFGFWVQHSRERSGIPGFDAFGPRGERELALFTGAAIDGNFEDIDYGFLGIASATTPIQTIHVRGDVALLDNFRFIVAPEPSTIWMCGMALIGLCTFAQTRQ
jgi:hypothetical protein